MRWRRISGLFLTTGDNQMKFLAKCWLGSLKTKTWIVLILSVIQWADLYHVPHTNKVHLSSVLPYIASPHFGNPLAYFELNPEIRNVGFSNFFAKLTTIKESKHLIAGATELEKKWKDLFSKFPSEYRANAR